MPVVTFPTGVFLDPNTGTPLGVGKVYIGTKLLNPFILGNRINVAVVEEDGSETIIFPASQPFILTAGGMFIYNGSVVQLRTTSDFSISVYSMNDELMYYFPKGLVADATFTGDTNFEGDVHIDGDLTIVNGQYSAYQRGAILNIESDAGVLEINCKAAEYFITTLTENIDIVFSNPPAVLDGYGQTWMLTMYDAGNFTIIFDSPPYTLERRSVDTADYGVDTKVKFIFSCCEPNLIYYQPLKDIVPNV
jgi:hypothetical protein